MDYADDNACRKITCQMNKKPVENTKNPLPDKAKKSVGKHFKTICVIC
jgi:hypothetical protein